MGTLCVILKIFYGDIFYIHFTYNRVASGIFFGCPVACVILVSQPGMESVPSQWSTQS